VTLGEKLTVARTRLAHAGISATEAAIDVDLFARTILGWERARLLTEQLSVAPKALEPRFSEWVERRALREPSAYIVGVREFWGLDFRVTPAVLIPRPETEFIIEETLRLIRSENLPGDLKVAGYHPRTADIGTGCGCIAVSLAHEVPDCRVIATDVSAEALAVARENATLHDVASRIEFVQTSYLVGVDGEFDVIAANPPYVRERDKPALSRDVRHEPDVALFGGATGLRDIEGVLDTAASKLRSGGWLVMEFGFGQEDDVRERVAAREALRLDRVREDLQGLARTAIVQRL
jgi:release factor glutamine methyltransferase